MKKCPSSCLLFCLLLLAEICLPSRSYAQDPPATHGMLVFGTEAVYASHLPMFHAPHEYQAIFELELDDATLKKYLESKLAFPKETVYTLEPEPFVLPKMAEKPESFQASLYRGHFERGGTPIATYFTVKIKRVIFFRALKHDEPHPLSLSYIIFGNEKEQYMAHRIAGQPDFDHISAIRIDNPGNLRLMTETGALLWQRMGVSRNRPLTEKGKVKGKLTAEELPVQIFVQRTLYTETDDLK